MYSAHGTQIVRTVPKSKPRKNRRGEMPDASRRVFSLFSQGVRQSERRAPYSNPRVPAKEPRY